MSVVQQYFTPGTGDQEGKRDQEILLKKLLIS
jgi:hypothetical protein